MNANLYRLESGQEYTIKHLFNGKIRIVIPDLQRDYCWGDKAWDKDADNYTELVSLFVENLISFFTKKPKEKLTLGLIYGYENPHSHVQLCDGQQRLTTLFLLIGMINRRTTNNHFEKILISKAELADDKEPNLQYAIRESTLYFLSDLVCEFFLKKDLNVNDIIKKDWYFKEYDFDATIQSMLNAIKTIESKLVDIDFNLFGEFIVNNLLMLYYDMGHRTRGEETFVIINTTGEPLTATENLKPILIGNIEDEKFRNKASEEWEDREEWFWQNKNESEKTSDEALKEFFIWYWQIRLLQEKSWKGKKSYSLNPNELFQQKPYIDEDQEEKPEIAKWEESKNLDTVHKYFNALVNLVDNCKKNELSTVLKTINNKDISLSWFRETSLDVVLPLIAYSEKFITPRNIYKFVRRIRKNFFDKKWADRTKNFIDWRHIIQIIEFSESEEDVLTFLTKKRIEKFKKIGNVLLNEWFNDEEQLKGKLYNNQQEIEKWEDHQDFMGDLSFFFSENSNPNIELLEKAFNNYVKVIDSIRETKEMPITNTFRLFLLFIGCEKVEHKPRVSWDIEGVLFSTIKRNQLFSDEFRRMCTQDDIENYCLRYIKNKIQEWNLFDLNESNFTTDKALKCWLSLKVFNSNDKGVCLAYNDGRNSEEGVSVNKNPNSNKLIDSEPFTIYNMICGFGVKSGGGGSYIRYTDNNGWNKSHIIDTTFEGISREKKQRSIEQLNKNREVIDRIITLINN